MNQVDQRNGKYTFQSGDSKLGPIRKIRLLVFSPATQKCQSLRTARKTIVGWEGSTSTVFTLNVVVGAHFHHLRLMLIYFHVRLTGIPPPTQKKVTTTIMV